MFKPIFLSTLLILGCSALPYNSNYGSNFRSSYGSGSGLVGRGYSSGLIGRSYSAPSYIGTGYSANQYSTVPVVQTLAVQPVATSYSTVGNLGYSNAANYLTIHQGQQFEPIVPAAIQQISRTVEYTAVPNQEQGSQQQVIEIEPSDNPVHLHFKTRSSTLSASQSHEAAQAGEVQTAQSQDEVQRLYTEVLKPVVQEVKEVITPYRQVTQYIHPVQESLHTVVTKGEARRQQYVANQNYAVPTAAAVPVVSYSAPALTTYQTAVPVATSVQPAIAFQSSNIIPAAATTGSYFNTRQFGSRSSSYSKPLISSSSTYSASNY